MNERTTANERNDIRDAIARAHGWDSYTVELQTEFVAALVDDAERLAQIEPERENALTLIRMRGVPEQRAEGLVQALDVLLTRLDREIQALRGGTKIAEDRLAAIERHIEALAERMKIADENLTHDGRHKEAQFVRHWISDMRAIIGAPEGESDE